MASQPAPNPFDKASKPPRPSGLAIEAPVIVGYVGPGGTFHPSELNTFHRNPRKGDVKAIAASLKAHDQYKPITVNIGTHTGRPHEVLAGNHTLLAIRDLAERYPDDPRWEHVLVHWVDVDDDRCNRIVAVDNRTGQLGGFDMDELARLLDDIGVPNLADIGYSDDDLADIKAKIEENALDLPPKPEGLHDISGSDSSQSERRDTFAETTTRTMILTLPIPQFVWAQEQLAQLRGEWGVDTNVDVVLQLLADETDSTFPDADAVAQADAQ